MILHPRQNGRGILLVVRPGLLDSTSATLFKELLLEQNIFKSSGPAALSLKTNPIATTQGILHRGRCI